MKKLILLSVLVAATGCSNPFQKKSGDGGSAPAQTEAIPNEFIFSGDKNTMETYLESLGVRAKVTQIEPGMDFYQVRYEGPVAYDTIAGGIESQMNFIEPHYLVRAVGSAERSKWPNDQFFFDQWGLNNIGQSAPFGLPGKISADMDVIKAWGVTKGSKDVVVAVIDTGIDYRHPDLKNNMWVNLKESEQGGGKPGIDDDKNGYVDDVYGFDFASAGTEKLWYGVPGDADPMDEDGHGTHCAGGIGAHADNLDGVSGVNQQVRLMAVRFIAGGGGTSVDAYRAIRYATVNKADIMSNSWGGGGSSKLIQSAIKQAQKAGILFVAAAGNDGSNNDVKPSYPASYDKDEKFDPITNILSVGASDNQDAPAEFSNYGSKSVHVFAPGVLILSTYPVKLTKEGRRPYVVMSGTSMATPYVAGVAALALAANPGLKGKPEALKQVLISSVDVNENLIGKSASNGRINAYKAVTANKQAQTEPNWVTKSESINERGFRQALVDIRKKVSVKGAKAIKVHFDFMQINEPYDSVYIYDKNLRLVGRVEESETTDLWSPIVPGDTLYVRFVNSHLQKNKMINLMAESSDSTCNSRGATSIVKTGEKYSCMVDSENSSDNKPFVSFNSEGYSIDQVSYIPGEGAKK